MELKCLFKEACIMDFGSLREDCSIPKIPVG